MPSGGKGKLCTAVNCSNRSAYSFTSLKFSGTNVKFFKFPKDPERYVLL